jgi:hypothetical protein
LLPFSCYLLPPLEEDDEELELVPEFELELLDPPE